LHVHRRAGVAVLAPGAPDPGAALQNEEIIDADLAQVVGGGLTAKSAAAVDRGVLMQGVRTLRWRTK